MSQGTLGEAQSSSRSTEKFIFVSRGGESSLPDSAERLDELVDAVLHSRYVTIQYLHFDGQTEAMTIRPLSMAIYDHQVYVIGLGAAGKPYPFRLSRIQDVDVSGETFDYPLRAVYDPFQVFRDSLGIFISDTHRVATVRVLLDKRWRTHCLTHRWHQSQILEETAQGIVVKLTVRICPELKAWILGFGCEALVLEPEELREEVRREVAATMGRYKKVGQRGSGRRARPATG
jgi:predicted DNA-binding transcriptional regulator YafY